MASRTGKPRSNSRGMTLLELLVTVSVAIAIMVFVGFRLRDLLQRARVSSAKASVSAIALALGMARDDTGFYPPSLADLNRPHPPDGIPVSIRRWNGPYLPGVSLVDPWGNPYFYELVEGAVFGPSLFTRPPEEEGVLDVIFEFIAGPGTARLTIINEDDPVTAGRVYINGEEVVSPDEFKRTVPRIEKTIVLERENTIRIWLDSRPGRTILLTITSPMASGTTFMLGSFGRNGELGGEGYDSDIIHGEFR